MTPVSLVNGTIKESSQMNLELQNATRCRTATAVPTFAFLSLICKKTNELISVNFFMIHF